MTWGFPRGSVVKNLTTHMRKTRIWSLIQGDPTCPGIRQVSQSAATTEAVPWGPGAGLLNPRAPERLLCTEKPRNEKPERRSQRARPAPQPHRVSQLGTIPHSKEDPRSQK